MCNSKCFAKPEKVSLLDILKMRGEKTKGEKVKVKISEEEFDLPKEDFELLKQVLSFA